MNQTEIYKMIEDKVIYQLENGIIPWRRCYHIRDGACAYSHATGNPYSFLNQFLLDQPGEYWTFDQAKKAGYQIRKGCKAKRVVFWKVFQHKEESGMVSLDGQPLEVMKVIPFLKYYNVFHSSDVIGLPEKEPDGIDPIERERKNAESLQNAEKIIREYLNANPDITMTTSDRTPCFSPSTNTIHIPEKSQFDSLAEYYSTVFHEMTHSTCKKVGRDAKGETSERAREELVAEIGAAYLCGQAGIEEEHVIKNNAAYCANWLKALRNNIKDLVWASARAERAVKYILNIEDDEQEESA